MIDWKGQQVMKIDDCYSSRHLELWRFLLKLKRIGINDAETLTADLEQYYRETKEGFYRGRRQGRTANNPDLVDLIISMAKPTRGKRLY